MINEGLRRGVVRYSPLGAGAGVLGGLLGVGGGVFLVPMLVTFLRLGQHQAHGTSLGIVLVVALGGFVPYLVRDQWDWVILGELMAGAVVGVIIGTKLMVRLPSSLLRYLFAALLLAVGVRFLILGS